MKATAVSAHGLGKKFEVDTVVFEALKNLDLTVNTGAFVSIYGHSGAGKSKLLTLICT